MDFWLQQTVNGIVLGSVYGLYASGFGLVMSSLRLFHVAHAAVFTWGAVVAWELTQRMGWSLVVALPVVMVAAGLLNVLAYFLLVRHLLGRRDAELAVFISSMGGLIALAELARLVLDDQVVRLPAGAFPIHPVELGPVRVTTLHLTMVGLSVALIAALAWALSRTQAGREVRTVAYDRRTAALLGIDVDRVSAGVFFVSGALAGLAAAMVAMAFNVVSSDLGSAYLVIALAAMVVGGFDSVAGALLGGLLVGLVSTYATGYLDSSYRDLVVFAALLLFLVVRPHGLIHGRSELARV
jgi:branched-chain amino acid transport system permease protein